MNQTKTRLKTKTTEESLSVPENYPKSYIAGLVIGVLLLIPSLVMAHDHTALSGAQGQLFHYFNNWPGGFTTIALWLSEGLGAAYPIALCVLLPLIWKCYRLSWRFLVVVGGTAVVMEIGKLIAKEPRPVVLLHGHLNVRAVETGLTSFPSGHTAVATAMALTLWLILPRNWRWLSVAWILIVAVSRLYLGVHAPVDVVGGFAIGLICVCVVRLLPHDFAKLLHLDLDRPLIKPGF